MDMKFVNKLREAFEDFSARDLGMVNGKIEITAHRTNDGGDEEEDWSFKVTSFTNGEMIEARLL